MASKLRSLKYHKVALVDAGANQAAHVTLYKSKEHPMDAKEVDALTKRATDAEAKVIELTKALDEATAPPVKPEPAKLPEAVQKQLDDIQKRNEALEQEVAKGREEKALNQAIQKAATLKALGNPDDIGTILYQARKHLPAETLTALEKKLDAWHEQIRQSKIFKALGSAELDEASAEGQLNGLAKQLATKENLPFELAFSKVCDTPDGVRLLKAARAEKGEK